MKLPDLKSAPMQRLALPEPQIAAAGADAFRDATRKIGAAAEKVALQQASVDFTDRYAQISNAALTEYDTIIDNKYTAVSDIPRDVDYDKRIVESRYDEETDTIIEMVPTYEIGDDLYQSRMNTIIGTSADGARNNMVSKRLRAEANSRLMPKYRSALMEDANRQVAAHNLAKYEVAKHEATQAGDESLLMEVVARNSALLGLNPEKEMQVAGANFDKATFVREITRAKTSEEAEAIQVRLTEGEFRFDDAVEAQLFSSAMTRENNLYNEEVRNAALESAAVTSSVVEAASDPAATVTVEAVNGLRRENKLNPSDYQFLVGYIQDRDTTFRTSRRVRNKWELLIESAENGDYPPGVDNFQDAQWKLRKDLQNEFFMLDVVTGKEKEQTIADSDYYKWSDRIQNMADAPYATEAYRQIKGAINIEVGGASEPVFDFGTTGQVRALAHASANAALNAYVKQEGPRADPVKWWAANKKEFLANVALEELLALPKDIRGRVAYTSENNVDYRATMAKFNEALKVKNISTDRIEKLKAQKALLDQWAEDNPNNVTK